MAMITEQVRTSSIASQASQAASQASTYVASKRRSFDTTATAESAARRVRSTMQTAPASTSKMFGVLKRQAQARLDELENVDFNKYLDQFGKEVKVLLKDAVTIDPGEDIDQDESTQLTKDVLFDVPEDIKRQIYTTRLDAQLHALHTSVEPFLAADAGDATYDKYASEFSADSQTATIADDLEHYPELRKLMEKLVPEKIAYDEFWRRYYFLREQINQEEARRKKLLTEAGDNDETFDWDEDEDDEEASTAEKTISKASNSTETLKAEASTATPTAAAATATTATTAAEGGSKPNSSRPSSESSYDLVSVTNSHADLRAAATSSSPAKASNDDEEEEDDWE